MSTADPTEEDITIWLGRAVAGDERAVQEIWEQYYEKLVQLARRKLGPVGRRAADEEDVALSAFHSFYRGATGGRFPQLADRHDLWKLLVTITCRKAIAQIKGATAQKRGGGSVRGESIFQQRGENDSTGGIGQILGDAPTPELAAMVAETCGNMLDKLDDDLLRQVAVMKMEGYSNEEIASELNCVTRTVERKLARIREIWGESEAA
jgi:DNA-directed RNA polymerase specialized sigma24 family protein